MHCRRNPHALSGAGSKTRRRYRSLTSMVPAERRFRGGRRGSRRVFVSPQRQHALELSHQRRNGRDNWSRPARRSRILSAVRRTRLYSVRTPPRSPSMCRGHWGGCFPRATNLSSPSSITTPMSALADARPRARLHAARRKDGRTNR